VDLLLDGRLVALYLGRSGSTTRQLSVHSNKVFTCLLCPRGPRRASGGTDNLGPSLGSTSASRSPLRGFVVERLFWHASKQLNCVDSVARGYFAPFSQRRPAFNARSLSQLRVLVPLESGASILSTGGVILLTFLPPDCHYSELLSKRPVTTLDDFLLGADFFSGTIKLRRIWRSP
jgi:hypothetical protein